MIDDAFQIGDKILPRVPGLRLVGLAEAAEIDGDDPIVSGQRTDLPLEDGTAHHDAVQKHDGRIAMSFRLDVEAASVRH
nr:hypothetical protein [Bradyrhizobium sp. AUGA SZCCT0182]